MGYGFDGADIGGLESGAGLVPEVAKQRLAQSKIEAPGQDRSTVETAGGALGGIIGGIAGAYFGGPQGAIRGAQTGYSIGSTAGGGLYDLTSKDGPASQQFVQNATRGMDIYNQVKKPAPQNGLGAASE